MVGGGRWGGETEIRTGSRMMLLERTSISGGIVAENSRVWRSRGRAFTIRRTSGRKPMSSTRPAPSRGLDDAVDAAAEGVLLGSHPDAPVHGGAPDPGALRERAEGGLGLGRE